MHKESRRHALFINEASSFIGMGHILRSQTLAKAMKARGYDVSCLTMGDENAVLYAQKSAICEQFEWPVRLVASLQSAIEYMSHASPDVIIVDCALASREITNVCATNGVPSVALDYFISEAPLPTAIINLIDQHPAALTGQSPPRDGVDYFEGAEYAIIREEFFRACENRAQKSESVELKNILVAFGGADPSGNTKRALDVIEKWPGMFHVDLVIGPLFMTEFKELVTDSLENCEIKSHVSTDRMGELLAGADLLFCGGGGTLLEAMCVGTPAAVIAQSKAEQRHAESLAQRKACWFADHVSWEIVNPKLNREERSRNALACVDGKGVERICDIIEKKLKVRAYP